MIKSTKTTLKYLNKGKLKELHAFIDDYKALVIQFVDILWDIKKVPALLPKSITSKITTNLSAAIIQCAGKQASSIVRGVRKKQQQREWVYTKLTAEGKHRQARKLKRVIDTNQTTKPNIQDIHPELDSRFIKQDWSNDTTFDGIITLFQLVNKHNKLSIAIPIKKHKHFNKLRIKGKIKTGIRLSKQNITFIFDLPDEPKKTTGSIVGLDVGIKNAYTLSTGVASQPDQHGHTLDSITHRLAGKKCGSKSFLRTKTQRTNYINWSINQINWSGVKTLKLENIQNLRRSNRTSRLLSHFTYTEIFGKLADACAVNGVQTAYVSPTYTSQRCSECGWVRSSNRKGKQFKCGQCGYTADADLNGALNIAANLRAISKQERLRKPNKKGFYWLAVEEELTFPSAQKPDK